MTDCNSFREQKSSNIKIPLERLNNSLTIMMKKTNKTWEHFTIHCFKWELSCLMKSSLRHQLKRLWQQNKLFRLSQFGVKSLLMCLRRSFSTSPSLVIRIIQLSNGILKFKRFICYEADWMTDVCGWVMFPAVSAEWFAQIFRQIKFLQHKMNNDEGFSAFHLRPRFMFYIFQSNTATSLPRKTLF